MVSKLAGWLVNITKPTAYFSSPSHHYLFFLTLLNWGAPTTLQHFFPVRLSFLYLHQTSMNAPAALEKNRTKKQDTGGEMIKPWLHRQQLKIVSRCFSNCLSLLKDLWCNCKAFVPVFHTCGEIAITILTVFVSPKAAMCCFSYLLQK